MIAHDPEHGLAVLFVTGEGAKLARHLRARGIGDACQDGGERPAQRPALRRVVWNARRHEQAADIGVAKPERPVLVRELGDAARGELRHGDGDLEHDGPQLDRVLIGLDVEAAVLLAERHQVDRGKIAGRIVEEHVFGARVRRLDLAGRRAGMPVVDGAVELDAGIGAGPGGIADLIPQRARLHRLGDGAVLAKRQVPIAVGFDRAQEIIGDAHRIVGVLARDGAIGLRIPIRVVGRELDRRVALAGELDHPADRIVGHLGLARGLDLALQRRVALGIEAIGALALAIDASLEDGVEPLGQHLRAGDERRHLLLLDDLPVDVVLDVGVVDVDHDHLGRSPRGAARLYGARRPVADLEEAHQARGFAATRQGLVLAPEPGEIGAGARAIFEQPRLAHPEVHDPALVDEIVVDRLDEAGMRLGMLVGRG